MTATEHVILVDENDVAIGSAEKLLAHQKGLCHRAFSVFVLRQNPSWEILLQQRAKQKYHSPLLWTNTCCSHPRPGETILAAAERRLQEEMGITLRLRLLEPFHYIAHFPNGLIENEIDHVLVGIANTQAFSPNPAEVQAYRWMSLTDLKAELTKTPAQFTPWLGGALAILEKNL